ncbi:MAG: GyrI-like domain-containing protein [Ginsengibacter sp.]
MKTLLISVTVICSLVLAGIYLFIPSKINFSKVAIIKTRINIANRFLLDESNWRKWFPADSPGNLPTGNDKNTYRYKNYVYSVEKKMMNAASVSISNRQILLESLITMISMNGDSIAIEWKSNMPASSNPVERIRNYISARKLHNNMSDILTHLQTFLAKSENVYGIHLHEIISKDSTLVTTRDITTGYPSTTDIYNLIASLKKYISSKGAKENNFPMLSVKKVNDTTFETMVAIPVNKYLEDSGTVLYRRFVPWKVLTAEVKGGDYTVNEALDQMAIYMNDYQVQGMALPFASLVTDRSKQADTLQWVTRIYTPIP